MNKLLLWIDDRTGYKKLLHEALFERIPGGARWRYVWGSTLVFTFVVQMITGIFLWSAYSPSAQTAWESVYYIQEVMTFGHIVRGIHHYAAQAMIVLMALHLVQVIIDGAYRAPREVNFWLGLILLQIVLGLSLTGYLLPWDQKGYYATQVSTKIMGATPIIGPQLQSLVQGGPSYGHHTLTRFFAMHAGILPGLLIVFIGLHLYVFRRHGITVPDPDRAPTTAFWPDQVLKDGIACLAVMSVVLLLAVFRGAELSPPANPAEAYSAARPEWYFLFLFQFLRFEWVEHYGLAFGAIYVPGAIMGIFVLMPFIGRWKAGHRFNIYFTSVMALGAIGLTILAFTTDAKDDGFNLAVNEAERDAHRVKELAKRPSRIPVEGAVTLLKNDPFTQGPRLFAKHCASCHRYDGHDGTNRMVYELIKSGENETPVKHFALPTAADLGHLGDRAWFRSLLVDYRGHFAWVKNGPWYAAHLNNMRDLKEAESEWEKLKPAGNDAAAKSQRKVLSEKLVRLGIAFQKSGGSRKRNQLKAARSQRMREKTDIETAVTRLGQHVIADDEADTKLKAELKTKLDSATARMQTIDDEIKQSETMLQSPPAVLKAASDDPAVLDKQLLKAKELRSSADESFLNPAASDMAEWYGDADALKALKDDKNSKDVDALIEYLVSMNHRADFQVDAKLAEKGKSVFSTGKLTTGSVSACTECHATPRAGGFRPTSRWDSTYPDLTELYSKAWLKDFLSQPARSQHYGVKNQMPGFADRLSQKELDLLVRWMVKDYYKTEIPDYKSRLEELQDGLKARPDFKTAPVPESSVNSPAKKSAG